MMMQKTRSKRLVMALSATLLMAGLSNPAVADPGAARQVIDLESEAGRFSGAVIVLKDGVPIVDQGWGLADRATGRLWQTSTPTRYASVTKQITALLVFQEIQGGRIELGAPLSRYIKAAPAWAGMVTIEHLLRHTSGLREADTGESFDFPFHPASSAAALARPLTQANRICSDAPVAAPGTEFKYGDCEYYWLGAVLEQLTGQSWDQLAQDRIARPLGLSSWSVARPGPDVTARGYVSGDTLEPAPGLWAYSSAAGMTGTLADIARFERALVRSELLDPEWTARMLAGREENQSHAMGSWSYVLPFDGQEIRFVERQGWVGGVRLIMISLPDEDLVIAMVSNDPDTRLDGAWNPEGFVSRVIRASRSDRQVARPPS